MMSIPITIIGGYLGSGKTTLLNRVLSQSGDLRGVAILVNDFGEVNIDTQLIRANSPDSKVLSLSNGCVCCSIADDFTRSLEDLRGFDVHHIIMETSGVALPAKTKAQCSYPGYHPRVCLVLIDAQQYYRQCSDKFVGHLVRQQVLEADVLVITKRSLVADFTAPGKGTNCFDVDDPELLASLLSEDRQFPASAAPGQTPAENHTLALTTCTLRQKSSVPRSRLAGLLDALPTQVQRVKGFAETHQGDVLVQKAGASCEISPFPPGQAYHLVFIASADAPPTWRANLVTDWSEWSSTP